MWKIAAIGECMLELSNPGGKAFQRNMSLQFSFGGDTLNTTIYLSRLGVPCAFVTALGEDPYSTWLLNEWQAERIDTSMVEIFAGRNPGLYMIQTDASGERSFHYWRKDAPVRDLFSRPEVCDRVLQKLRGFDLVYLSGITLSLYDQQSLSRLFEGLEQYRQAGGKIAFDGNYRPAAWASTQQAQDTYKRICAISDLALPTFDDEEKLFGDSSAEETADRLHGYGVTEAVVKLGARGVLISVSGAREFVATTPVDKVIDSTAAGDSFNGGYLAARARDLPPARAAGVGNRLAGCVIQHPGAIIAQQVMPTFDLGEGNSDA